MNRDETFEQRLERLPLREPPAAWRKEILNAALAAGDSKPAFHSPISIWVSSLREHLAATLWPQPRAWATLGAIWILILTVNLLARDDTSMVARADHPAPRGIKSVLRHKHEMFAELGLAETTATSTAKSHTPRPHSQWLGQTRNT